MGNDSYSIYQIKETDEARGVRFEPLERLKATGGAVDHGNYDLVYGGPLEGEIQTPAQRLEAIYQRFNVDHPMDFAGHSLSVSDVVVLRLRGEVTAHYVDRFGFAEVPEFLDGPYLYYATQRPVDIGTFPKTDGGPVRIENYDARVPVEDGAFVAWGCLTYSAPLAEKQAQNYELRPAINNPDLLRVPPRQLHARVQAVGRWEQAGNMPEARRTTEQRPGHNDFRVKASSAQWLVNLAFRRVQGKQARAAQKKPIAAQLAEGAEQAAKENAARLVPDKSEKKPEKDDR
ncbi:MAG: YodL domain-containing protein [Oscillospiraceae bacterium]|nr:YodL domain-containing protein [Oscillospiraceae bacterium]